MPMCEQCGKKFKLKKKGKKRKIKICIMCFFKKVFEEIKSSKEEV